MAFSKVRPIEFMGRRDIRRVIRTADAMAGIIVGDTIEHMVPKSVLRHIDGNSHRLDLDMLNLVSLPRVMNATRGCRRIGCEWTPPLYLRGVYARSAMYIAAIGSEAAELVDERSMRLELAGQWCAEFPMTEWERRRASAIAYTQGRYVLRQLDDGTYAWRDAVTSDRLAGIVHSIECSGNGYP
jgi:hypothetical protein